MTHDPLRPARGLVAPLLLLLLLVTAARASFAQEAATSRPVADVSDIMAKVVKQRGVPGMAAAIVNGDQLLALGAAGERARGSGVKVMTGDKFHLGSCTKSMTATMIATLVEQGVCRWNTTVGEVFTEDVKTMDPAWKNVTLEQLLTNSGGAPADLLPFGLWRDLTAFEGDPVEARRELVKGVVQRPPEATPGTKFIYSNAGFSMAGAMAEKLAKKPYEQLMQDRIFQSLGMASAGFDLPGTAAAIDEPRGHSGRSPLTPGPRVDNPDAISPAGKVHANLADWGKYVSAHLRGERSGPESRPVKPLTLLAPATFVKLHAPALDGYAMGWAVAKRPWAKGPGHDGRVLTHNGSNTQWFCVTWLAPERDFAVLVACNEGDPNSAKACDDAAAALIEYHLSAINTSKK